MILLLLMLRRLGSAGFSGALAELESILPTGSGMIAFFAQPDGTFRVLEKRNDEQANSDEQAKSKPTPFPWIVNRSKN
jgi:hypothetical protein